MIKLSDAELAELDAQMEQLPIVVAKVREFTQWIIENVPRERDPVTTAVVELRKQKLSDQEIVARLEAAIRRIKPVI
jgi:hypothetical protein